MPPPLFSSTRPPTPQAPEMSTVCPLSTGLVRALGGEAEALPQVPVILVSRGRPEGSAHAPPHLSLWAQFRVLGVTLGTTMLPGAWQWKQGSLRGRGPWEEDPHLHSIFGPQGHDTAGRDPDLALGCEAHAHILRYPSVHPSIRPPMSQAQAGSSASLQR